MPVNQNIDRGGGFFQGVYDILGPKIERQQQVEDEFRQAQSAAIYKKIDELPPGTDPNEIQQYLDQILKMYNGSKQIQSWVKDAHDKVMQVKGMLGHTKSRQTPLAPPSRNNAPPSGDINAPVVVQGTSELPNRVEDPLAKPSLQATLPNTIEDPAKLPPRYALSAPSGTPFQSLATPSEPQQSVSTPPDLAPPTGAVKNATRSSAPPSTAGPVARLYAAANPSYAARAAAIRSAMPGASDAMVAGMLTGHFPPGGYVMQRKMSSYVGQDGLEHTVMMDQSTGQQYEVVGDAQVRPTSANSRPVPGGVVSVRDAKAYADQGVTFNDESGKPIDPKSLADGGGLKMFTRPKPGGGSDTFYQRISPNQRVINVAGEEYAVSPMEISYLGQGAGMTLGQTTSTLPRTTETIPPTIGPNEEIIPGQSTSSRPTPGVQKTGGGSTQTPSIPTSTTTPPSASTPPPAAPIPHPGPRTGSVPINIYNRWAPILTRVRESSVQLFGDPTHPDLGSLDKYGFIADDPVASQHVANAIKATLDPIVTQEKAHGGLVNLLRYYGGIPENLIKENVAATRNLVQGELKTEPEQKLYNAIISSYGTIMGLRAATGASAAKFSTEAMERELPIPGRNTPNASSYYDKLSKLAEEIVTAMKPIPSSMMAPGESETYPRYVDDMLKKSKSAGLKPPPGQGVDWNKYKK